jgi:hypothetical protein
MKMLVTELDRKRVHKWAYEQTRYTGLAKRDRLLLTTQLEWEWWARWRKQQEEVAETEQAHVDEHLDA